MYTIVVGECSTGKSAYLMYLKKNIQGAYFIGVDDARMFPVDTEFMEKVFDGPIPLDGFGDKEFARRQLTDMCRACNVLLVDEIGFGSKFYSDGRLLSNWLAEIGKFKDVIAVSHDMLKLYNADKIITVTWDKDIPIVHEVDLDEAEKIVSI